jgi:FtsP/CotA-like multicopper oxidase with cupredoxin domain
LFAALFAFATGTLQAQLAGQIPLNPKNVPQFVDPMPHFAGVRIDARSGGTLTVTARPNVQTPLSTGTILATGTIGVTPGVGMTRVWGYEIAQAGGETRPVNWPGFTVEAQVGKELTMNYVNGLGGETYANVGLIVDQTLHWASPGGMPANPTTPYTGAPPIVVHLHGGEVPSAYDGGPDSWFMAGAAGEKGSGYVTNVFTYPNAQEEATIWFHDHALGATRLNVYAGMAAFYLLRGPNEEAAKLPGWSGDNLVAERNLLGVLAGRTYRPEIEIAIQDRMFDDQGQLYFPANLLAPNPTIHPYWVPEFVGDIITVNGKTWPYQSVEPRRYRFRVLNGSNARFYELALVDAVAGTPGPAIWQIGTDGGLLDRPVKLDPALGQKLILAPGERADIIIDFNGFANGSFIVRNSGRAPYPKGAPVNGSTTARIMKFVVGPTVSAGSDPSYNPATLAPLRAPLFKLANFATGLPAAGITVAQTRQLTLNEVMGPLGPAEILVNNSKWDGRHSPNAMSADDMTGFRSEMPVEGTTEIWKIINLTADAHPIHLHLVQFQLLTRQAFNLSKYVKAYNAAFPVVNNWHDPMMGMMMNFPGKVYVPGYGPPLPYGSTAAAGYVGGNPDVTAFLQGPARPALPNENGWKDTFIMYPGEVTTVIVRFAPQDGAKTTFAFDPSKGPGYVWHCHIVDHEDNEMMRPYGVLAAAGAVRSFDSPDIAGYPAPHVMAMGAAAEGAVETLTSTVEVPQSFELGQNYPNPFNPTTEIRFALPLDSYVRMTLYNSLGQQVQTLIDAAAPAGYHTVKVNASSLASGTYF